jgi:hypothetical protein
MPVLVKNSTTGAAAGAGAGAESGKKPVCVQVP